MSIFREFYSSYNMTASYLPYAQLNSKGFSLFSFAKASTFSTFPKPSFGSVSSTRRASRLAALQQFTVLRCFLPLQVSIQTFTQNLLFQRRPNLIPNRTKLNPTLIIILQSETVLVCISYCKFSLLIPMFRQTTTTVFLPSEKH